MSKFETEYRKMLILIASSGKPVFLMTPTEDTKPRCIFCDKVFSEKEVDNADSDAE